jgi:Meiotically up-regulated gene 113
VSSLQGDISIGDLWLLPRHERVSVLTDFTRRYMNAAPELEWYEAQNWADEACAPSKRNLDLVASEVVASDIAIRVKALWVAKQVTALECFADPGPSGDYSGAVYFLRAGPFVKIGFTSGEPDNRVKELRTGCPYRATLIGLRSDCTMATQRWLHQIFENERTNLEWFNATDLLIRSVLELSDPEFIVGVLRSKEARSLYPGGSCQWD